jgi:hypothetical protein
MIQITKEVKLNINLTLTKAPHFMRGFFFAFFGTLFAPYPYILMSLCPLTCPPIH